MYIMASRSLNLYTGITDDIFRRALEHKGGEIEGFTKRYNINRLVYYETFKYVNNAIVREKQIKAWTRAKRIALIRSRNPAWQDLAEGWGERFELQIPRSARDDNELGPRLARDDNESGAGSVTTSGAPGSLGTTTQIELQIPRSARDDNQFGPTGRKEETSVLASSELLALRNPT